jgi:hypothetical protein
MALPRDIKIGPVQITGPADRTFAMDTDASPREPALRLAATEPAARPDFYRQLLEAQVFVIGESELRAEGAWTAKEGESISLQHWSKPDGSVVLPFFTSLAALQRAVDHEVTYYQLPARALLEMTQGATLVLDPRSDYGKEFAPGEIVALLSGGLTRAAQSRVIEEATQVLLAQPAERPDALIDGVRSFLARRPAARRAWLALMHIPTQDPEPHLVIGVEADGDADALIAEIGNVAADLSHAGPVDLVQVRAGEEGLSRYFLEQVEPFFSRD